MNLVEISIQNLKYYLTSFVDDFNWIKKTHQEELITLIPSYLKLK